MDTSDYSPRRLRTDRSVLSFGSVILSQAGQVGLMILSRTPLRISFVGGGTDIPSFYQRYGGEVISTAIDKYISVRITEGRNSQIAVSTPHHCETVSTP